MKKSKLFNALVLITIVSLIGCLSVQCRTPEEAPTIELEIYDGPDFSESDDMCYYRIEATVTGMPDPEVNFSTDDNVSPLGPERVEVGVNVGDSYTLTATATNTAGTASATITLLGECGEEVAETASDEPSKKKVVKTEETTADDSTTTDTEAKEKPTIDLQIYIGPVLEGDICYYRIEAVVTGNPSPSVNFSKDDSGGTWGPKRTQINLNDPSDSYTLTATATNSEGSATDSIDLSWGCEVPEPEPEPEPIIVDLDIVANASNSGYIVGDEVTSGSWLLIGDMWFNTVHGVHKKVIALISFNISSISGLDDVTIKDVSVIIPVHGIIGHPEEMGPLNIYTVLYGDTLVYSTSLITGGVLVKTIDIPGPVSNFNFSSSKLKEELQETVDKDIPWFQLKISLSEDTNYINIDDLYRIPPSIVELHIKYETPR